MLVLTRKSQESVVVGRSDSTFEQNDRLERCIERRTGGRVHNLRVETIDGRVIVHGCSGSYHVQQLALAAVLESFEASDSELHKVELDIEICGSCLSTVPSLSFT